MRRRTGIVAGACAALVLAGTAGAVAWTHGADRRQPVGTWHEAPVVTRTPVAVTAPIRPAESGRQRVGASVRAGRLLGYADGASRRETFRYPGSSYVKLHFDRILLRPGDHVTVADPAGRESYRYAGPAGGRWAMSISGDTAVLSLHRAAGGPAGTSLSRLGVRVDRVARGFTRAERGGLARAEGAPSARAEGAPSARAEGAPSAPAERVPPTAAGREESVCGADTSRDAVCYRSADPVAYTRSKAIARLLINGTELCTGWRISTRNRMLTNNHCFDTSRDAYHTEVWFDYQCAACGGTQVVRPTKVWGDRVVTTNRTYDYTLFTVEDFDRIKRFGALALDTRRPVRGQELYVAQHPGGEPARISGALGERAGNCAVRDNAYDGYARNSDVSYYCDTEGGSSGSPVLSRRTNRVVALHHFGGCPNSGVRADILAARLKGFL